MIRHLTPVRGSVQNHRKRKEKMSPRRRYTRNEKVFYVLSLLIVFSMVLSLIYVAIMPN